MKEIKTFWFTNFTEVVGIVVGEDEVTGERKAYVGAASGIDERADIAGGFQFIWPVRLGTFAVGYFYCWHVSPRKLLFRFYSARPPPLIVRRPTPTSLSASTASVILLLSFFASGQIE